MRIGGGNLINVLWEDYDCQLISVENAWPPLPYRLNSMTLPEMRCINKIKILLLNSTFSTVDISVANM